MIHHPLQTSKFRMAGIYIHIPFCKKRCLYCDFFSSTSLQERQSYVEAVCKELEERKEYLNRQAINTIYFGGGTPSLLSYTDFEMIFQKISEIFNIIQLDEVTLEANPDDLTPSYITALRSLPFNRISIGIQSFNNRELSFLNRRHDAISAIQAVKDCQQAGFENISIDLMYGLPNQTLESWKENIQQAIALQIQHISAYHLTYEKDTTLYHLLESGKINPVEEELSVQMFTELIAMLTETGFVHYEISNFGKPGYFSKHNTSYWTGKPYLGVGASAHSFNGQSRQWNGKTLHNWNYTTELIDEKTAYNEYILTRLRTMWGMNRDELETKFGQIRFNYCMQQAQKYLHNRLLEIDGNHLKITRQGLFVSDGIMSDLME